MPPLTAQSPTATTHFGSGVAPDLGLAGGEAATELAPRGAIEVRGKLGKRRAVRLRRRLGDGMAKQILEQ